MAADTSIGARSMRTRAPLHLLSSKAIKSTIALARPLLMQLSSVLVEKAMRNSRKTGKPVDVERN